MKYCTQCGAEILDEAVICVKCGCATESTTAKQTSGEIKTIAKIFMLIGCISSAFCFLFPLCWTIPMTMKYRKACEDNEPVSTGFKVCSLIFVSSVAGILMLCDNDN